MADPTRGPFDALEQKLQSRIREMSTSESSDSDSATQQPDTPESRRRALRMKIRKSIEQKRQERLNKQQCAQIDTHERATITRTPGSGSAGEYPDSILNVERNIIRTLEPQTTRVMLARAEDIPPATSDNVSVAGTRLDQPLAPQLEALTGIRMTDEQRVQFEEHAARMREFYRSSLEEYSEHMAVQNLDEVERRRILDQLLAELKTGIKTPQSLRIAERELLTSVFGEKWESIVFKDRSESEY